MKDWLTQSNGNSFSSPVRPFFPLLAPCTEVHLICTELSNHLTRLSCQWEGNLWGVTERHTRWCVRELETLGSHVWIGQITDKESFRNWRNANDDVRGKPGSFLVPEPHYDDRPAREKKYTNGVWHFESQFFSNETLLRPTLLMYTSLYTISPALQRGVLFPTKFFGLYQLNLATDFSEFLNICFHHVQCWRQFSLEPVFCLANSLFWKCKVISKETDGWPW